VSESSPPIQSDAPGGVFHWRGKVPLLVLGPLTIAAATSPMHAAEDTLGKIGFDLAGLLLIGLAIFWRTWATLHVGGRKTRHLVTSGPYSLSRHPLYFGSLLTGLALATYLQSATLFVAVPLVGLLIYVPVIREEERALGALHPEELAEFRQRVPRKILPGRMPKFERQTLEVSTHALGIHVRRSLVALAMIPAAEVVSHLRTTGVIPVWFGLP